jgi:hypothetical protein
MFGVIPDLVLIAMLAVVAIVGARIFAKRSRR